MDQLSDEAAVARIDAALATLQEIPAHAMNDYGDRVDNGRDRQQRRTVMLMKSAIDALTHPGTVYRIEADRIMDAEVYDGYRVEQLTGILLALKEEIQRGFLNSLTGLVEAGVFADFLEMADELLEKGYETPAAVLAGSVLEEHLRSLARPLQVVVEVDGRPVKADRLNAELVKAGAYEKGDQKQVTAWFDLRNNAAHGHFGKYDNQLVSLMLQGIRGFMLRYPVA